MPEDVCMCCLFPLMIGLEGFTLWSPRGRSGWTLTVVWWDLVHPPPPPSPMIQRQKVAQRRWMEASAVNPSEDTALLLICLQRAGVGGCGWEKEGSTVLLPADALILGMVNVSSPPGMDTPMMTSHVVLFPAAHHYSLQERTNHSLLPGFLLPVPKVSHQPQLPKAP